jgi:hypothetical protein
VDRERAPRGVEKAEVEWEAHAEGVDAGAVRDQDAGARFLAVKECEAEQAGAVVLGDLHIPTENRDCRQSPQSRG